MKISFKNRVYRFLWQVAWLFLFFPSPKIAFVWRVFLLKVFGAKISWSSRVYPSAHVWQPNKLSLGYGSCLASGVNVYNVSSVEVGDRTVVSQKTELITATKSFSTGKRVLKSHPITIGSDCWLASNVTVCPGITIGNDSVILMGVTVLNDIPSQSVVKPLKNYTVEERR